ncbi:MAG TPA: sensor histidine kinase [Rhodocyclaceae bacterium]|nr:sensor histidine kinase [Rhodocyclaceae bacterium]
MDLRKRLVGRLAAFSLLLLAAACALVVAGMREDVAEEIEASSRLAELMLGVSEMKERGPDAVRRMLDAGGLRHLAVSFDRPDMEQVRRSGATPLAGWVAGWLPLGHRELLGERRIALGDEVLVIRPDPLSEIDEILQESGRMIGIFAVFVLVTIAAAWRTVQRALTPVQAIERGLGRLAQGERQALLPQFELNEFRRIAGAIERLAEALQTARMNERRLGRRLIELQEAERRELARELHDEFGQALTAVGVAAAYIERHAGTAASEQLVECAREIRSASSNMAGHVRGLLRQLRPHGLEGLGMVDALDELLEGWRQREPGIALVASLPEQLPPLSPTAALALYRTVQEALTNVRRHSGAARVELRLAVVGRQVVLSIADDGCGCDAAAPSGSAGGLLGMRERAAMAGGELAIETVAGGGMRIELAVPAGREGDENDDSHPLAG